MQQIAEWLDELGLSEHTERFVENKIDLAVLPLLTDEDLKEIGIPLGHRRKILAAINQGTRSVQPTPVVEPAPTAEPKRPDAPERRYMTVLFSDLVGSTALSARMDPEDLREVISAYQTCVAEAVNRFGGFVAKYMGDGVLVYFGYPEAHENDPERAVRAGLELVSAVARLDALAAANAGWHRERTGDCRGPHRPGCLTRTGNRRKDPELGCSPAKFSRAEYGGHSGKHPEIARRSVRVSGLWPEGP
jgi:SAM domain (Sterile alpha motif)/Adenylate and Guanylate cyclase catalytic domain